nr:MAG TPA: Transcription factor DP1, Transcription factor factor, cell-cycle regulation, TRANSCRIPTION.9A [Caudoviricetes sp.]DAL12609.1 MAG TPA_asm: Transcription factor DP1, Transcription factor factor, cell-cycle regulation, TRANSCRIPTION.9A [Caudoviricetes sp.]
MYTNVLDLISPKNKLYKINNMISCSLHRHSCK